MNSIRREQDPDETSPLLRGDERTFGHSSSSSSSNGSTTVGDSPSVAATDLPDAASPAPPFGPLFGSLAVDSLPGQSPSPSSSHTTSSLRFVACMLTEAM